MRILTFNYEYPPLGGGGGVVHQLIAEELARRHTVAVVTSAHGSLPARDTHNGVEIFRVPVWARTEQFVASLRSLLSYPPTAALRGAQLARDRRWDIVHGHFAVPTGPASLLVARAAGLPHVLSLHGGDIYDPSKRLSPHRNRVLRGVVGAVLRASDAVVAQSTNTRDNAYRYYRYRGPIEMIPLGIRQPQVQPATRTELGLPERKFLAVTVGRLVPRKGIRHLIDAIARDDCAGVHLVVVGDGPERDALRAAAAAAGVADRTSFTGFVDEEKKWQILACADAYLSATMHEGFGLVYLEAMASGVPVVTPDHGGQIDFLRDGETGFLVPAGDGAALSAAIARLAKSNGLARRIGAANRDRAQTYHISRCAEAYEALYERLLPGGREAALLPLHEDTPA